MIYKVYKIQFSPDAPLPSHGKGKGCSGRIPTLGFPTNP